MSISAVGVSSQLSSLYGLSQTSRGSQNDAMDPDEFAASIVEQDDADGDGLLSLEETPLDEDRFNSMDSDGDGFVSAEELSADAQERMDEMSAFMGQLTMKMQGLDTDELASSILEQDDADGDGVLSLDETPLDEETFNSIDADGDGSITAEELSADMEANMAEGSAPPPPPPNSEMSTDELASSILESTDTDDDSLLSLNETGLDEDTFNAIDSDGDGSLTADELSAYIEEQIAETVNLLASTDSSSTSDSESSTETEETSSSSGSGSGESEEEYDTYDLNEDGVVTMDELYQAYQSGDDNLSALFDSINNGAMSAMTQRIGMQAYQEQMTTL